MPKATSAILASLYNLNIITEFPMTFFSFIIQADEWTGRAKPLAKYVAFNLHSSSATKRVFNLSKPLSICWNKHICWIQMYPECSHDENNALEMWLFRLTWFFVTTLTLKMYLVYPLLFALFNWKKWKKSVEEVFCH